MPSEALRRHTAEVIEFPNAAPDDETSRAFPYWRKYFLMIEVSRSDLPGVAVKVMMMIVDYANSETGVAWPAIGTLAHDCRVTPKVVRTAIRTLEQSGWINVDRTKGGLRSDTHKICPAWDRVPADAGVTRRAGVGGKKVRNPCPGGKGTLAPEGRGTGALQGSNPCPGGHPILMSYPVDVIQVKEPSEQRVNARGTADFRSDVKPARPSAARARKIDLPPDFELTPDHLAHGAARHLSEQTVRASFAKWKAWRTEKNHLSDDWDGDLRAWIDAEKPNPAHDYVWIGGGLASAKKVPLNHPLALEQARRDTAEREKRGSPEAVKAREDWQARQAEAHAQSMREAEAWARTEAEKRCREGEDQKTIAERKEAEIKAEAERQPDARFRFPVGIRERWASGSAELSWCNAPRAQLPEGWMPSGHQAARARSLCTIDDEGYKFQVGQFHNFHRGHESSSWDREFTSWFRELRNVTHPEDARPTQGGEPADVF